MLAYLKNITSTLSVGLHKLYEVIASIGLNLKTKLQAFFQRTKLSNLFEWAKQFTPSQLCYFIASLLLIPCIIFDGFEIIWVALIAFAGLLREVLNVFHKVWESTIGKSLVVVLYASTANLALAFAALKINAITSIEPAPFIFTLGFTTLMLMPFWIALSSIVIFLLVLVLANVWLLISLLLRLVGFNIKIHWEDKKRAVLTMILRIVLIPIVLAHLVNVMLPFANTDLLDGPMHLTFNTEQADFDANKELPQVETEALEEALNGDNSEQELRNNQLFIENIIANFIFYFESYPSSACIKSDLQRSVMINEDLVLLISRNEQAIHGYDYEVRECLPRLNTIAE
ncbi:hypothetical protein [Glaciecola sp. SC05]|uniref:hypothetical protein n=1 Tax=Glaciecola sp. SC05 TaxID=1987355 RepID=UPI003529C222